MLIENLCAHNVSNEVSNEVVLYVSQPIAAVRSLNQSAVGSVAPMALDKQVDFIHDIYLIFHIDC